MRKNELYNEALARSEHSESQILVSKIFRQNPWLKEICDISENTRAARLAVKQWVLDNRHPNRESLTQLREQKWDISDLVSLDWKEIAALRILDYIKNAGRQIVDENLGGKSIATDPIGMLWQAARGMTNVAEPAFYKDMLHLFGQLSGKGIPKAALGKQVKQWMRRHPSGLETRIVALRKKNRKRILETIVEKIDKGEIINKYYRFEPGMTYQQRMKRAQEWWNDKDFHLRFAVRSPKLLNELLDHTLPRETMETLYRAQDKRIPFFVNPYYLSLLNVHEPDFAKRADLAIRDYVIYSEPLVEAFGTIRAWEKEDLVEHGKPNAAGWLLPNGNNIHRRYPKVAILIPDTEGRACAGLCASCQRMYGFQRGRLNFEIQNLTSRETWPEKLERLMEYFEKDSMLRDILITGGDAFMNSDRTLAEILDAVYKMTARKRKANQSRPVGKQFAEIQRVRLGTRLPVYLPQRISPELVQLLASFKKKATKVGISQFIIQTHFESAMEITPEARDAVSSLISAGWFVTNQVVFTAASSRRGHVAKLRAVLNDIGVLPYYTFAVKGYNENRHNIVPAARLMQEIAEEKTLGALPKNVCMDLADLPSCAENIQASIRRIREAAELPFLSTDRNIVNLPGVGKSFTFRVIGITRDGRRILEFEHDPGRAHSPIIESIGNVILVETKSIAEYLAQLEAMGEDVSDYEGLYAYSWGETEPRMPIYQYPEYTFEVTKEITHFEWSVTEQSRIA